MTRRDRPRALYVWDADYPWDIRTEKVCRALVDSGFDVEIVARNRAWKSASESLPEGIVHRMHPWRLVGRRLDAALSFPAFANPRWISLLVARIASMRPDVVIVRDLPLSPTALWAARRAGLPVVVDLAENYPAMIRDIWEAGRAGPFDLLLRNPRAIAAVERYVLPRVDHVITVVEESAARMRELGVRADRLSVVSNTPSRERVSSAHPARRSGPLRLTYLGLMEVPRGILDVLNAVAELARSGAAIELVLIGDGRDRRLFEERAASHGLVAPTVRFLGALPNAEALRQVAEADVGLVPHHATDAWNTTIPNKLFDYMAAGLPVLSSDAVPAARIVRESGAGIVHRSRDSADLAKQLRMFFDPARRQAMADAGRRAILERYNWEADTAMLIRVLRGVMGRS